MATVQHERVRVTARIPAEMRDRLEEAAELMGSTLNQFVVQSAVQRAQRVLERETTIRISREAAQKVLGLIDEPPRPTKALRRALKRHRELLGGA